MIETVDMVEPWIYSRLAADENGSTGIVDLVGIDSISGTLSAVPLTPPYVTFLMNSTVDVITAAGGDRISTENLYVIKAVAASGTWDDVRAIANRIDSLFHLPNTVVTLGGGSLSSLRERVISYPEIDEGVQYRHLGGIFRIRASAGHQE